MRDLPRSSVKREGAFVSLMVGFFDEFGITISELRHSKVLGDTSAVNCSQYSRSFSGHVPVPPTCIVVYMCYISWLQFPFITIWKAGQEKEVVTTLIEEMYPYKNPKVLSIDNIIKPDNSTQLKTIKAPRKSTTRCSKV